MPESEILRIRLCEDGSILVRDSEAIEAWSKRTGKQVCLFVMDVGDDPVKVEQMFAKATMFDEMRAIIGRLIYGIIPHNKAENAIQIKAKEIFDRATKIVEAEL